MSDRTGMAGIEYDHASHTYCANGKPLTSVTKTISEIKPVFDKEKISKRCAERDGKTQEEILAEWEAASLTALAKGSATHSYIEDLFKGVIDPVVEAGNNLPELSAFGAGWGNLVKNFDAKIVKQEFVVGDEELGVAGTVDAIASLLLGFQRQIWDKTYHVFDWKTGKKFDASNRFEKLLPPFQDLDNCHLNLYSLQTSMYRLILERNYNLNMGESYLIHLRTDGTHFVYRGRDYRERVKDWLLKRAA